MPARPVPESLLAWQMTASSASGTQAMECRELPMPDLKPGDALVEIAGCGVCGTDLGYFFDGIPTVSRPPLTLGHEVSGTVVAGEASWVGKDVVVPTILPCRKCGLCRSGRANRCLRQKMPGNSYGPYGGFASHIVAPARELCALGAHPDIGLQELAVVADAVATPFQAAHRAELQEGDQVIIVGATGGLGIHMVQWAKLLGARCVVGVGRNEGRLDLARSFGIDLTLCSGDRTPPEVRREFWSLCRKNGLDPRWGWKIFEMSGTPAGQETALELLSYAGMMVVVGYNPDDVTYELSKLMAFDAEIRGTWGCLPEHYEEIAARVLAGDVEVSSLVEVRPMSTINEVFQELRRGRPGLERLVLAPDFP